MSNLLRRASDAFHHHQRKSSEDSVNQDSLVNPAQEPQEPVEPQIPAVSQPEPQESKVEAAAGESKDQAGNKPAHHHNLGWFRRPSVEEREKRR
ncbi:uncharacterized protein N7473_012239 [Penicillium subrubescens]|uniref:Uncharacterized protein n=1 Tax=Penicillium subrubescens TaxID=1316194 RepID=A0A1Q5UDZ8_9EURO|nr:uncharacterized protein N7473_012239 [Penicillium subrubescens]KAJ5881186.1 hypothetical protein N7473_012239 [Penicillium subrubescens]OKP10698.1 hypothetical protein PENSUB_4001 [Penicillium subrubescens]